MIEGKPTPSSATQQREVLRDLVRSFARGVGSQAFLRLVAAEAVILVVSLAFLGIAFMMMAQGLTAALVRIAAVWPSAGRLVGLVAHNPDGSLLFPQTEMPLWRRILIALPALLWLGMAGIGVWLLATKGFLAQNLIYQLLLR